MTTPRAVERKRKPAPNKDHLSVKQKLKPMNEAQRQSIFAFEEGYNVLAYGSAGSGKSYIACHLALERLFAGEISKIIIVRSAVQVRDVGFTPGNEQEKAMVYAIPYKCIINDICGNGTAWDILVKKNMLEFVTTSFIRGITLDDCVVIFDETQNCTFHEASSVITRAGKNCQIFASGDTKQTDLCKKKSDVSGFPDIVRVIERLPDYWDAIKFTSADIVRSSQVKAWIVACEELDL